MKYQPLNVEFVNPFVESTYAVFRTMLGMQLKRGSLYLKQGFQPSHEISGIIGLSGRAQGVVLLGMGREVATEVTNFLTEQRPLDIDSDVIDAIGELANMIAGGAKTALADLQMSISLPSVIAGRNHTVSFPTGAPPIGIPFESPFGPLALEVSLVVANPN
jgi:chemotaxis protein CheX